MRVLQMEGNEQKLSSYEFMSLSSNYLLFAERQEMAEKDLLPHEDHVQK